MKQFRKIRQIIISLLIPAIIVLFFNHETNKHVHILPNGQIIVHSHPFNKDIPVQHKHSKKELLLFSQIFNSFSSNESPVTFIFISTFFVSIKYFDITKKVQKPILFFKLGRAPPALFSI